MTEITARLWHAIQYLFPDIEDGIDYVLQDDGEGPYIAEWNLPDPIPDEATIEAARLAYIAEQEAAEDAANTLQQAVLAILQSGVGLRPDQLDATQLRAYLAALMWKEGGLNSDLTIKPPEDWLF